MLTSPNEPASHSRSYFGHQDFDLDRVGLAERPANVVVASDTADGADWRVVNLASSTQ